VVSTIEESPVVEPVQTFEKYGQSWPVLTHDLTIELACYLLDVTPEEGGLGKAGHYKEVVHILWGPDNPTKQFIWTPWGEEQLAAALKYKYLSMAGCANSGKTDFLATYGIVNWLADPMNTTCLFTSISLTGSRGRVWGSVEEYWTAAQKQMNGSLPGKLVSSIGVIKLESEDSKLSSRCGLHLIAAERRKEQEAIGKLIGLKSKRKFLYADELPELSHSIMEAAVSNLDSPGCEFQTIGTGNPNSIYDPHGKFSKPKAGWKSVSPADSGWETDLGYCIRFDAEQSPNIMAGEVLYPWLPTVKQIEQKKLELGEESLSYYRMFKGYWCPTGGSESVVSEADIVGYECEKHVRFWKDAVLDIAFLDPGFTNGGDRSILSFARLGTNVETQKMTLDFLDYVPLFENTMQKEVSRNFQIAHQFRDECIKRGITPDRASVDDTGAAAFGDIVWETWSKQVTRINFGGKASMNRVSAMDKTKCADKYANRATEIWCSMREYIRSNQIRGIDPDSGAELSARRMVQKKSGLDLKAQVEPKPIMRSRIGKSPDIGDSRAGTLCFARDKFHFRADKIEKMRSGENTSWRSFLKRADIYGRNVRFLDRSME
jgi:hypothetical protein